MSVPPFPLGGSASRTAVVVPPDVEPVAVALVFEVERPENPSAATAEKTIVSTIDVAAVTRVARRADRMPLARTRPRFDRRSFRGSAVFRFMHPYCAARP